MSKRTETQAQCLARMRRTVWVVETQNLDGDGTVPYTATDAFMPDSDGDNGDAERKAKAMAKEYGDGWRAVEYRPVVKRARKSR